MKRRIKQRKQLGGVYHAALANHFDPAALASLNDGETDVAQPTDELIRVSCRRRARLAEEIDKEVKDGSSGGGVGVKGGKKRKQYKK